MENCPVCGNHISPAKRCDLCGFDDSCNYEAYMALGPVPAGVRSLAGMRLNYNQKHQNRPNMLAPRYNNSLSKMAAYRPPYAAAKETIEVDDSAQEDVFPLRYDPYSRVRPVIATGMHHTVGVKKDGTVIAVGRNDNGQCNVRNWRDIVAVAAGRGHTVGLKKDGTVISVGGTVKHWRKVKHWRDIVAIEAGVGCTVGLKKDGTVVEARWDSNDVSDWQDIVAIAEEMFYTAGLKADGTVVEAKCFRDGYNVSDWRNIAQIAVNCCMVGLKKDGTVITDGSNYNVSDWRDIVAVAAGNGYIVGLKKDGMVVAVRRNDYGQCNVSNWRDIVAIAAKYDHTVGLKKDGTVVAVGLNDYGQADVDKYKTWIERKRVGLFSKTITRKQTPWKLF